LPARTERFIVRLLFLAVRLIIGYIARHWLLALSLIAACIVYGQLLQFGPISWDDPEMVFRNRMVRQPDLQALFARQFVGNYIPVTMIVHTGAYALFGDHAGAHHLVNVCFHLVNGVLLFFFARSMRFDTLQAQLAASIFILHPLQVESVAWIAELKTTVCGLFSLLSLIAYRRYAENGSRRDFALTAAALVLGCLSKPSAVAMPLCYLATDLFVRGAVGRRDLFRTLPFFAMAIGFGVVNIFAQREAQFINYSHMFPFLQRTGFAGFALLQYARLFILPVGLSVIYPFPRPDGWIMGAGLMAWIALGWFVYSHVRKGRQTLPALSLFVLFNLMLVLQFIPFGEVLYADRYMYLPLAGFALMLAMLTRRLKFLKTGAVVLLLVLSVLSAARTTKWNDALTLYEDILRKYPGNFVALNSAGVECMARGLDRRALDYFDRAVNVSPKNYKGYYNRGLLFLKTGKPDDAIRSFNAALRIHDYAKSYTGRASAWYTKGDLEKALADANHALRLDPGNARALFVSGNCLDDLKRHDDAIDAYTRAIAIAPEEADFYLRRAVAYGKLRRFQECLDDLDLCIRLRPSYPEAFYWRGVAKLNLRLSPCEDFRYAMEARYEPAAQAFNSYCK
jgi:protein O-mannosyl-transferase